MQTFDQNYRNDFHKNWHSRSQIANSLFQYLMFPPYFDDLLGNIIDLDGKITSRPYEDIVDLLSPLCHRIR